jgi:hypothetical protein
MLVIDIHDHHYVDQIREAIQSKAWERNLEAIACARRMVMEKYQLFPFMAQETRVHRNESAGLIQPVDDIFIPSVPRLLDQHGQRLRSLWRQMTPKTFLSILANFRSRLF